VIDFETFARIKHLHEQKGLKAAQIARELGLDERTVRRRLAAQQFLPRKSAQRPGKLDPFKDTVVRMVESYPYSAAQILQRLREEGFAGGYTAVKKFVSKVRPKREKAFLKLAFAPGECAQVDWGSYGAVRNHTPPEFLRHGALLQPPDVCGIHRVTGHGAFPRLSPERLCCIWRSAGPHHGR
jgi:transposase